MMMKRVEEQLKNSGVSKGEMRGFVRESILNIIGHENVAQEIQNVSGIEINPLDIIYFIDYIYDGECE